MIRRPSVPGCLLSIGLLLGVQCAVAQTPARPPAPPPSLFSRVGVIHSLDAAAGVIVVSDMQYRLPQTVRVYAYDRNLNDHAAQRAEKQLKETKVLREGLRIGYNVTDEGGGKRGALTEIWLLPAGQNPEVPDGEKREERGKGESKEAVQGSATPRTTPRAQTTR